MLKKCSGIVFIVSGIYCFEVYCENTLKIKPFTIKIYCCISYTLLCQNVLLSQTESFLYCIERMYNEF